MPYMYSTTLIIQVKSLFYNDDLVALACVASLAGGVPGPELGAPGNGKIGNLGCGKGNEGNPGPELGAPGNGNLGCGNGNDGKPGPELGAPGCGNGNEGKPGLELGAPGHGNLNPGPGCGKGNRGCGNPNPGRPNPHSGFAASVFCSRANVVFARKRVKRIANKVEGFGMKVEGTIGGPGFGKLNPGPGCGNEGNPGPSLFGGPGIGKLNPGPGCGNPIGNPEPPPPFGGLGIGNLNPGPGCGNPIGNPGPPPPLGGPGRLW
ncbi:pro-resilin-like [Chenopodium quinoa]|uniref:pro-resilin-like n=1 Tax=Chenopodium quinoa TaxID=63459 RepID=UPI000B7893C1|nr:pro-resilin-like [Chenopodium quinoa]